MDKVSEEYTGPCRSMELLEKKRREDADKSLVSELYKTMLECGGISDTAAELEAELKLEAAVRDIDSADIIMDLAAGCSGAGKEAGFKMGFHIATRLIAEGMKGTGC